MEWPESSQISRVAATCGILWPSRSRHYRAEHNMTFPGRVARPAGPPAARPSVPPAPGTMPSRPASVATAARRRGRPIKATRRQMKSVICAVPISIFWFIRCNVFLIRSRRQRGPIHHVKSTSYARPICLRFWCITCPAPHRSWAGEQMRWCDAVCI